MNRILKILAVVAFFAGAAFGQALSAGTNSINGTGSHTRTLDFPAQVEIYAVGAGGGGQGGHNGGDGGSGGGGAAVYMRYNETSASSNNKVTFSVSVGAGGHKGNPYDGSSQAGRQGGAGGNTTVSRGSWTLVAAGGEGGGPGARRNDGTLPVGGNDDWVKGGSGGQASSQPNIGTDIIDWATASGNPGMPGVGFRPNGKCIDHGIGNGGGYAGLVVGGSLGSFGGGHGGYRISAPCADTRINATTGGGGVSGYGNTRQGHLGGNGQVIIVVTRLLYTVTFHENGGRDASPTSRTNIVHGTATTAPDKAPTRTGYDLAGWWTAQTGGSQWNFATGVTNNMTLWARWTPITYTISYNLAGGSVSPANPTTFNFETNTITLTNPTRTGYTFTGWTGYNGNTPQMTVTIPRESTGNRSFTANWTPIPYSITYNLNGGTNSANPPDVFNIASSNITLPTPTREHFTFGGWFANSALSGSAITSITTGSTGNRTFWARWNPIPFTVKFDLNYAGAPVHNPAQITVNSGNLVPQQDTPTREYHVFMGWALDAASSNMWRFANDIVRQNITLFAQWRNVAEGNFIEFLDIPAREYDGERALIRYDGQAYKLESVRYVNVSAQQTMPLLEGTDFTATYFPNNIDAGTVNVEITGIGSNANLINGLTDANMRKMQFTIEKREVGVIWGETDFAWNGKVQVPTAKTDWNEDELELTVTPESAGQYYVGRNRASATLKIPNQNIVLSNAVTPYRIIRRSVPVKWYVPDTDVLWDAQTHFFTFNRRNQSPEPRAIIDFLDGSPFNANLNINNRGLSAEPHTVTAELSSDNPSVLWDDVTGSNIALSDNNCAYEIRRAPLTVRLHADDDNTIDVGLNQSRAFIEGGELSVEQIERHLAQLVEFEGFKSDEAGNSDGTHVLRGETRLKITELDSPQNAPNANLRSSFARNASEEPAVTETTRKFSVEIDVENLEADDYAPQAQEGAILTIRTLILANTAQIKIGDYLQPLPKIGDFLQAIVPGEGIEQAGTLNYEWEVGGVTVPDNNSDIFEVREDDIGKTIRVIITGSNTIGRAISDFLQPVSETSITQKPQDMGSALFKKNPVRTKMEITLPKGERLVKFTVLDALGNLVHNSECGSSMGSLTAVWDLRNSAGRFVANGSYLVVVEAMDRDGKVRRYSGKVGVKR